MQVVARDYFTFRERIVTVTKQVCYLKEYVKDQCQSLTKGDEPQKSDLIN
ncbi:TPA: hypothetical protein I8509_001416 [Citrobacter freundii]|nr:hypothetical protein [Citrobacter freundii]HAT3426345.1 hypothetical protein [Citrobacter freundii]